MACAVAVEGAEEPGEQLVLLVGRDAHAGVEDHHLDGVAEIAHHQLDAPTVGSELHPVADQVEHQPLDVLRIALVQHRHVGQPQHHVEVAGRQQRPERVVRRPRGVAQVALERLEPHLPRLDLGEQQQVLDEEQQPAAVALEPVHHRPLVGGQLTDGAVLEQLDVADHAGERGAELVADRRHEVGLDLLEVLQPLDGGPLVVEGRDQGGVGGLALGHVVGHAQVARAVTELVLHLGDHHRQRAALAVGPPHVPQVAVVVGRDRGGAEVGEQRAAAEPGGLPAELDVAEERVGDLADHVRGGAAEHRLGPGLKTTTRPSLATESTAEPVAASTSRASVCWRERARAAAIRCWVVMTESGSRISAQSSRNSWR